MSGCTNRKTTDPQIAPTGADAENNIAETLDARMRACDRVLTSVKAALAGLSARRALEAHQIDRFDAQTADLVLRAGHALEAGSEDLAEMIALSIAERDSERRLRMRDLEETNARINGLAAALTRIGDRLQDLREAVALARRIEIAHSGPAYLTAAPAPGIDRAHAERKIERVLEQTRLDLVSIGDLARANRR